MFRLIVTSILREYVDAKEHLMAIYRVSINSFPYNKHLLQETLHCTSVRRVLAVDNFPTRWCTSTLGFRFSSVLDATFPNRWIGRDGPTPWPPRSPDITPLDFLLWRYVKVKVFSTPVPDIRNLKARSNRRFCYNN